MVLVLFKNLALNIKDERNSAAELRPITEYKKVVFPFNQRLQSLDLIHLRLVVQFLK